MPILNLWSNAFASSLPYIPPFCIFCYTRARKKKKKKRSKYIASNQIYHLLRSHVDKIKTFSQTLSRSCKRFLQIALSRRILARDAKIKRLEREESNGRKHGVIKISESEGRVCGDIEIPSGTRGILLHLPASPWCEETRE